MALLEPLARTYPAGVTSWIETRQPDVDAAIAFYGGLFGWEFEDVLPPDAPGRYVIATLGGLDVASITNSSEATASWETYIAVDDADAVAARLVALGAVEVEPVQSAGPAGRSARFTDPQGAPFSIWQAGRRLGAQVTNAPGAWNFSDLHTSDPAAAQQFYSEAFGWRVVDQGWGAAIQVPGYGDHLEATVDPDIRERQANAPEGFEDVIGSLAQAREGEPTHWHVTFTVGDRDAAVEAIGRLGGQVLTAGQDDWSRHALVRDPGGAIFTASQFSPVSH